MKYVCIIVSFSCIQFCNLIIQYGSTYVRNGRDCYEDVFEKQPFIIKLEYENRLQPY